MDALTVSGLSRRLAQARAGGADAIVLQLDTPGGDLLATLELCRQIKADYPPNTIAWIRPRAYSAGVITALACREIVVAPHAVLGDAAPIAAMPLAGLVALPAPERAKLEAPLLSEVTDSSRRAGHDERLARAFVAVGEELWLVEDGARGERYVVDANEYQAVFGEAPVRTRGSPSAAIAPVTSSADPEATQSPTGSESGETGDVAAEAPTLIPFRTDALRQAESVEAASESNRNQAILPSRAPLTAADRPRLRLVSQIDAANELLTLQADEAIALGVASATIADEAQMKSFLGASQIFVISAPWSEQLARLLTSWWARTLLVTILVICFFGEMSSPGLGMFGLAGAICVMLLAGGSFLAGLSEWWPALAILVGLVLIALEMLLFPGSLVSGILGVAAFTAGVIGLFLVSDPTPESTARQAFLGVASLVTSVGGAVLVTWLLGPRLQMFGPWKSAVNTAALGVATAATSRLAAPAAGTTALAATDLRPVGRIELDGVRFDARSEGSWIPAGARVRILRAEGNEMIVEHVT